ncbi:MAG: leucine-rich repeat domain-containing protein [Prevotella sp.]|nr:leucine-rich repeat domain-containing protein [Prevotella sp.]MCM1075063.1 leucine-rich repeat domain-containing protein [Ruminococcus sp.]
MKLRHLIICTLTASALGASAVTINITPGSLAGKLSATDKADSELTLTGSMDMRDFNTIVSQMPGLKSLDIENVTISAYESVKPVTSGPMRHAANELPEGALLGLQLTELKLPSALTSIGSGALAGGKFKELSLPGSLTEVGDNALYGCTELETLTLPATVISVGTYALAGCTALENVDLSATQIKVLSTRLFSGDTSLASVSLPASVISIGEGCFSNTPSLQSCALPSSLASISVNAFTGSGIESVSVPTSVTEICDFAFSNCPNLKSVSLANSNAALGRGLFFADPEFVTFTAPGLREFPDYLFANANKFEADSTYTEVAHIGDYSLRGTGAKTLKFGSSLVYLGNGALENMTSLNKIDVTELESNVPELGNEVFAGINQPTVELKVASDSESAWKRADQWQHFKIVEEIIAGIDGVAEPGEVKCRFSGTVLLVDSDIDISLVEVYDPSGAKVIAENPRSTHADIDTSHLSARVYIVRVYLTDGDMATFKLMR